MRSLTCWALTFVALGCAVPLSAQPRTVDPVTTTNVSGYRSNEVTWLASGVGNDAMFAISWFERGDKPCAFSAYPRSLAQGSIESARREMNICGPSVQLPMILDIYAEPPNADMKRVVFDGNPRHYIRGIAACTNNSNNHRLKGIRIYPASVSHTDGTVTNLNSNESASRTNCSTWHQAVYCPSGQVASAIVVHHSDEEATGLALRCRRVVY